MEGVEQTKKKYNQVRIHREAPLNTDIEVYKERQDYKIGTVCGWGGVLVGGGRVNEGD
jgi:hypothetical protein